MIELNNATPRYYADGVEYSGDTTMIHTEYGRIRRNAAVDPWKWDYFLKDHLGNVRVVLEAPTSSAQSNTILYMATMEESRAATEDTYFANLDETRADRPYNYPDKNLLNAKLAKVPGKSKGPSILLPVLAGDTVSISAKAFYNTDKTLPSKSVDIAPVVGSAIAAMTSPAGTVLGEATRLTVDLGAEASQSEVYINNEAQTPVYYDNFTVAATTSNVVEINAYYPYGMVIPALSIMATPDKWNGYKYSGKELQKEMELNWGDHGARMADYTIGRWWVPDPLSEEYYSASPYAYTLNNPILFIDPDGRKIKVANRYAITADNIARIYATNLGQKRIDRLVNSTSTYTTMGTIFTRNSNFDFRSGKRNINFVANPWLGEVPNDGGALTSWTAMGHEIEHNFDYDEGRLTSEYADRTDVYEPPAVSFENYLREVYSISPYRNKYGNIEGNFHQYATGGHEKITDFTMDGNSSDNRKFGFSYTKTTSEPAGSGFARLQKKNGKTQKGYMIIIIGKDNISIFRYDDEDEYKKNIDW